MSNAIAQVTVGVAGLEPVVALWVDRFGLEIAAGRQGPDAGLGKLWGLPGEQIVDQLLLRTPGASTGWLHFVQFAEPARPVRDGAAATDLCPKSLDVNCREIAARHAELQQAGYQFRSPIAEYEVDDIHAREVQMPGHDETNIVLLEILSEGFDVEYSAAGYGALTSFVVIVPDTEVEADFYTGVFGLDPVMHHRITGPGIEAAIGLPKGSALDMRLMGAADNPFGRVELIEYEGLDGANRFDQAQPPATGALHISFAVPSLDAFAASLSAHDWDIEISDPLDLIYGEVRVAALYSPAGLRIEVFERLTLPSRRSA